MSANVQENVDVAVVGGGLGGLITAIAVRRSMPGASVKVYEQFPAYRKAGALLGLAPNGQSAMRAMDPALLDRVVEECVPEGRVITYDGDGNKIGERETGAVIGGEETQEGLKEKYGAAMLRIGWWELHTVLRDALPEDVIRFDHKFARYEEDADGVAVHFERREAGDSVAIGAKLLIGADGGFSAVRRQCLGDGLPDWKGSIIWRARVPAAEMAGQLAAGVMERNWVGAGRIANLHTCVNAETKEGAWVGLANKSVLGAMGVNFDAEPSARTGLQVLPIGRTAFERCSKVFDGFPAEFRTMLDGTDPDCYVEHGVWTRGVERRWGAGRVTLLGDAAHPVRPVTGQGFSQAAEDALELAAQLQTHGCAPEALRKYEDARLDRAKMVAEGEQALAEAAYAAAGQSSIDAARAANKRTNYIDSLFRQQFEPLR